MQPTSFRRLTQGLVSVPRQQRDQLPMAHSRKDLVWSEVDSGKIELHANI
jgi:hypothetical protein